MRLAPALLAVVVSVSVGSLHADPAKEKVTTVDPGATRRTASTWLLVGAGGLFATSIALSLHEKSVYDHALAGPVPDRDAANHAVLVTRYAGTGLFLAGAAVVGAAVYLRVTAPEKHTIIAPAVAPDSVGAVIAGSF